MSKALFNEVYIACFDCLGYKEFIERNDDDTLVNGMGNIFRDIELCISQGKMQEPRGGIVLADISQSRLNSMNFSDTIVFWTNDLNQDSLLELFDVAYEFNWRMNKFNFPVRGAVIKGKVRMEWGQFKNTVGGTYNIGSLVGPGYVNAHIKAEQQDWAGTVVDGTVANDLSQTQQGESLLTEKCNLYNVPYKSGIVYDFGPEYVYKLEEGKINSRAFDNIVQDIRNTFQRWNKPVEESSVQRKIQNTIDFLKLSYDENLPIVG